MYKLVEISKEDAGMFAVDATAYSINVLGISILNHRRKDCNSFIRDCKHLQPSDELLSKLNQIAEKKDMDDAALELNADQPVDDAGNGSNVSESSKASKTRFHHRDCLHGATSDSKATANRRRKSKVCKRVAYARRLNI